MLSLYYPFPNWSFPSLDCLVPDSMKLLVHIPKSWASTVKCTCNDAFLKCYLLLIFLTWQPWHIVYGKSIEILSLATDQSFKFTHPDPGKIWVSYMISASFGVFHSIISIESMGCRDLNLLILFAHHMWLQGVWLFVCLCAPLCVLVCVCVPSVKELFYSIIYSSGVIIRLGKHADFNTVNNCIIRIKLPVLIRHKTILSYDGSQIV